MIPSAFNAGGLDSARDPERGDRALKVSIVRRIMEERLVGAYFFQGAAGAPHCDGPSLFFPGEHEGAGAQGRAADILWAAVEAILSQRPSLRPLIAEDEPDAGAQPRKVVPDSLPVDAFCEVAAASGQPELSTCAGTSGLRPVCESVRGPCSGTEPTCSMMRMADAIRQTHALLETSQALARAIEVGLVDREAVRDGARDAFAAVRAYQDGRKWRRPAIKHVCLAQGHAHVHRPPPVLGMAIKGGAATGIYSAGIVWTVLNLIHSCNENADCRASARENGRGYHFHMVSGTSTGAMIATAVDRFDAATKAQQGDELRSLPRWFTCYSLTDLYCAEHRSMTSLLDVAPGALRGVLKFDGIARILARCADRSLWTNESELLLNTVDFRTGRLFSLSDQGELFNRCSPSDSLTGIPGPPAGLAGCPAGQYSSIVGAAVASAELPLIGQPETRLPTELRPATALTAWPGDDKARLGTFLDGGIRSELPVLPLVRRGAERVIVVGSSAAMLAEARQQRNALEVATRYIDIETGAVTENEVEHADVFARSERFGEISLCKQLLEAHPELCSAGECDADAFCEGRFDDACTQGDGGPAPTRADARSKTRSMEDIVGQSWKVLGLFRDEERVQASSGYSFIRADMQRLFRAGMETARLHCAELADLLGMPWRSRAIDLAQWCAPPLPADVCKGIAEEPFPKLRTCSTAPTQAASMDHECGGSPP